MKFFKCPTVPHLLGATTLISIIVLVTNAPNAVQAAPLQPGTNIEFKRYCSNTLSDAINLICGGRFNSLSRRFPDSVGMRSLRPIALKNFASDDVVFYRPQQTGPIHECCRRPCGYSELKMYCAPD